MEDIHILKATKALIKIGIIVIPAVILRMKNNKRDKALDDFYSAFVSDDQDTALWHINKYIENNKKDAVGHMLKGMVYHDMARYEEAVESFRISIDLKDDIFEVRKIMGDCLLELEQFRPAIGHYTQAISIDKKRLPAYFNRGVTYMHVEEYENALKDFRHVEKKEKGDKSYIYEELSALYLLMGNDLAHIKYASLLESYS